MSEDETEIKWDCEGDSHEWNCPHITWTQEMCDELLNNNKNMNEQKTGTSNGDINPFMEYEKCPTCGTEVKIEHYPEDCMAISKQEENRPMTEGEAEIAKGLDEHFAKLDKPREYDELNSMQKDER